jgi:threonine dehydratase
MTMIPPFDHRHVIAGQGTLGLELLDQVPEVETILVPLSGGGLISGVAAAVKARKPQVRIIGISMERGAAMHACLRRASRSWWRSSQRLPTRWAAASGSTTDTLSP